MEFAQTKEELWMETEKLESFLGRAKEFTAILYVGGFGRKILQVDFLHWDIANDRSDVRPC